MYSFKELDEKILNPINKQDMTDIMGKICEIVTRDVKDFELGKITIYLDFGVGWARFYGTPEKMRYIDDIETAAEVSEEFIDFIRKFSRNIKAKKKSNDKKISQKTSSS